MTIDELYEKLKPHFAKYMPEGEDLNEDNYFKIAVGIALNEYGLDPKKMGKDLEVMPKAIKNWARGYKPLPGIQKEVLKYINKNI